MPKIDALRQSPEFAGLTDAAIVKSVSLDYPEVPIEQIARDLGVQAAAPAQGRTLGGTLKDAGITAVRGAIGVPEAAVGLADLATGGRVGKALAEGVEVPGTDGFRLRFAPGEAKAMLGEHYSDPQKQEFQAVEQAEGFLPTLGAALSNPSVIVHSIGESLPAMGAGGVLGRAALGLAGRVAPALAGRGAAAAGAFGEGTMMAGSAAEQIRQQTDDGLLTGTQAGLAAATGVAGGALSMVGASVAKKLGLGDIDTAIVAGQMNPAAGKGLVRRVLEGALAEGGLEELPQSVMEQVLQNAALNKPLDEGIDHAAVLGLLSGGAMGGGVQMLAGKPQAAPAPAANPNAGPLERAAAGAAVTPAAVDAGTAATAPDAPAVQEAVKILAQEEKDSRPDPIEARDREIALERQRYEGEQGDAAWARDADLYEQETGGRAIPGGLDARADYDASGLQLAEVPDDVPDLDLKAHEAATSPTNDRPEPTPAQIEAGNYKKGHLKVAGLDIAIENPQGSERRGVDPDGKEWARKMSHHYGYIKRTEGADGDHVDVYVGPRPDAPSVFIVDQIHQKDGAFDEHKVMMGFASRGAAVNAYKSNFDKGWKVGRITEMPLDQFKDWIKNGDTKKPVSPKGAMVAADDIFANQSAPIDGAIAGPSTTEGVTNATATEPQGAAPTPAQGAEQPAAGAASAAAGTAAPVEAAGVSEHPTKKAAMDAGEAAGVNYTVEPVGERDPAKPWRLKLEGAPNAQAQAPADAGSEQPDGQDAPDVQGGDARPAGDRAVAGSDAAARAPSPERAPAPAPAPAAGQRVDENSPEARWTRMPTAERIGLLSRTKARAPEKTARIAWADLSPGWHTKLAKLMDEPAAAPAPAPEPKRGTIGMKLAGGEVVLTASGRQTQPFPKVDTSTNGKANNTVLRANRWLISEALAEAQSRGDQFNERQFQAINNLNPSQADKDSAEEYLFGEQPPVIPSILKPLAAAPESAPEPAPAPKPAAERTQVVDNSATNPGEFIVRGDGHNLARFKLTANGNATGIKHFFDSQSTRDMALDAIEQFVAERRAQAAAPAPAPKAGKPAKAKPQASANTVFTEDAAAAARALLKKKLGQLNSGIDPELLQAGLTLAGYHIERGARTFAAYARAMLGDLGDAARPYLKSWYMGVKYDPRASGFAGDMSSAAMVEEFDVNDVAAPTQDEQSSDTQAIEAADTPTDTGGEPEQKETLLGASDDPRRNGATDDQPLDDALPGADGQDGQGGSLEAGNGLRAPDAGGNGQPESGGAGRGDGLDGNPEPVLPRTPAEVRPAADGPVGHKDDRPRPLAGENPGNFAITDDFGLGQGTDSKKVEANLQALRTLRRVQAEHRYPTREEQAVMARYVGWGGLKSVFDPNKADATDFYGRAQRELKQILSDEEYRAANGSIRNAHYTAQGVVDAMWRAVRLMGFKGGRVLEPTVGIGNFIGRMPADMAASSEWHASELDAVTGQMAAMLYPEANVLAATGFQAAPFADGAFDLSIGNPPFGAQPIEDKTAKRKHLSGMKIHNYIIAKTGMHLRPGGVMSMVVTHRFLDTANPEARDVLAKDFRFLGAFRLPNDAFAANAGTEVVTDVVFLQKLRADEPRERDASWLDVNGEIEVDGQKIRVNRYYQEHPTHILGRSAMDGTMYAGGAKGGEYTVHGDGRDIEASIDEVITGPGFAAAQGALAKTDADRALAPAMLAQSDLPVGGVMLDAEGKIIRRELDDDMGNAVVSEITAETLWKEQAAEWQALIGAAEDVKKAAQAGRLTGEDAAEVLALAKFLYKADGTPQTKATKAAEAVYALVDALARPDTFQWAHDGELEVMRAALSRKKLGADGYRALKGMLDLRNRTLALVRAEQTDAPDMERLRGELNAAYDAFVKEHGFLSDPANANLLDGDIGAEAGLEASFTPAISAAVAKSTGVPARKAEARKADILAQRVNFPYKAIDKADSPADALIASLTERGKVDLPYMARITGQSILEVVNALTRGENPQLFRDPETGEYQEAERYLSGNVRHKLTMARTLGAPEENIRALQAAQPAPKTKAQVKPNIRGMWMPKELFEEFLGALGYRDASVSIIASQGLMTAQAASLKLSDFGVQFRHERKTPIDLFNAAASGKPITIYDKVGEQTVKNEKATKEVNALVERMGKVFMEWAYSDDARVQRIVGAFNDKMNTHAPRSYDGVKYLKPVGASPSIQLRRTQKNAAWRMMQERTMLADHVVGAGKTFTLITGIMERRRMGLSRKPMVVVPNHLVTQWARDFYKLYPGAKVLAATPADFAKKNRRRLLARIATGDYDAVIVGHTSIGFMETPADDLTTIINEKLDGLKEALEEARRNKDSKRTLGQIQDRIDRYKEKLKTLTERTTDDIGIDFKALGVDYLAVDEAHEFKNLEYSTSGERVVGMNDPNGSKKAFDLYGKVRGLLARGGGVAFATGTPVSNSLVEIYTMMSYLAHDELLLRGQEHFDAWSGAYAATETRLEYTATQKLKPRRVLAGLNNLSALRQLYEQFADIITMADLKRIYAEEKREENERRRAQGLEPVREEFPVPKVKGGKRQLQAGPITEAQREYMDYLVARMAAIERNKSNKEYARIDNALNVLTDARKMSLDIRIVDPGGARDENGKVATAAKNILATYEKWSEDRGTQMVFCDLSTPAKTAQKDARRLIGETAEKLFGKDAKAVKRRIEGQPFEAQWKYLTERAEELQEDPEISEERRDEIAAYMDKIEDAEATMSVADIGFSVYDDLKALLIDKGIPESEVAFIHDYNTPEQKEKLFDRVNNGYVRVLIGSSAKMGAGTNAQRRLVALHHMDAPWRPSDVEQREGRIIRQGNMFYERDPDGFEVEITAYSTSNTSDTVMWQILQRKAGAIEQFREGGLDSVEEEGGDSDQYAEFMATSTGNPVFRQKLEAERKLTELSADVGGALIVQANARAFLTNYPGQLAAAQARVAAFDGFAPESASFGGESGTVAEFDAAMEAARADYEAKHAAFLVRRDEAATALAKWENEPEQTRGKKPPMPVAPPAPSILTESVRKASGYARAMAQALKEATVGKTVRITAGDGVLELTGTAMTTGDKLWELELRRDGKTITVARSTADSAWASSKLAQSLLPSALAEEARGEVASAKNSIAWLQAKKQEADRGAALEVDTSKRDAAEQELRWYEAQVAFAETQADVDRGARANRFIARDKRRPLDQSQAVQLDEPKTIEVDGQGQYRTTGLTGTAGWRKVLQAERADGTPAFLLEHTYQKDGKNETAYRAFDMPESLRKAERAEARHKGRAQPGKYWQPMFSQGASTPAAATRKHVGELQQAVDSIREGWARAPEVVVTASVASPSVPAAVRAEARALIAAGGNVPSGVWFDGRVYLFADRLPDADTAAEVLFHEALGHMGLRGAFGASLDGILKQISMARPAEIAAIIRRNGFDQSERLRAAEELLAEMAQKTPELGFVRRAVAAIRSFLRDLGLNLGLSDDEIVRSFIVPARAWVVRGNGAPSAPIAGASFSQRPGFTFPAESSPLHKHRTATQVHVPAPEVVDAALQKDANARRILGKGIQIQDGELVGVRLNVNVLKSTGVAVQSIHRGKKTEGHKENRGLWGGEVINYLPVVTLKDAYFNVGQKAREKIASDPKAFKEPMASVDGHYSARKHHSFDGVEFRFNPKREHLFRDGLGRVLRRADEVTLAGHSVFARGNIEYYGEEDVPARAGDAPTQGRLLVPGDDGGTPLFNQGDDGITVEMDARERLVLAERANPGIVLTTDPDPEDGEHMSATLEVLDDADKLGGRGTATRLYLRALAIAQAQGMGWTSEGIASDATERMYERLTKMGIPFRQEGRRYVIGPQTLAEVQLPSAARPMFSQGPLGLNNPRDYFDSAMGAVREFADTPGKLNWWQKSLGTPYDLAQRHPRTFGRVYDRVQAFLRDVSLYATEAADLAPRILPKLDSWRDAFKSPLSAEDSTAIQAPIFEGTLAWTRDERGQPIRIKDLEAHYASLDVHARAARLMAHRHVSQAQLDAWRASPLDVYEGAVNNRFEQHFLAAGIVWTDAELRKQFNLTDAQIGLYREARAAIDKSLAQLVLSDMVRFGGKHLEPIADQIMEAPNLLAAGELAQQYLMSLEPSGTKASRELTDTAAKIMAKAQRGQELMDKGYAPLSRFGKYTVDVVDADGERVYFGLFESRLDARAMAAKMAKEFPGAEIRRGTTSEQGYQLFAGVSPETVELFGELLGLEGDGAGSGDVAFQKFLKEAKASRSAMKRLIHRKGTAGFSEDVGRVLAGFVYSNARQTANALHGKGIAQAVQDIPQGQGELKDAAVKLMKYVSEPQEEAQALRGVLFAQYLGGSIAAMLVNMTQPFAVTAPYLTQFASIGKVGALMKEALAGAVKESTGDAALDKALKHAAEQGIVAPQEVHQLMAQAQGKASLRAGDGTALGELRARGSNLLSRTVLLWGQPFAIAELFNRRVTFIAAYRAAQAKPELGDPAAFAAKAISDTQFVYNKGNKPTWARGAVGSVIFTFKQYSISYVELAHRMATRGGPEGKKAALLMLGMLMLMGGAGGLPFVEDVSDVIDGAGQRLGYNLRTKHARQELLRAAFGEHLGDFLDKGVTGLPGMPIDLASRFGMGNLVPGTGLLTRKQDHTRDLAEIVGPAGDLAKRAFEGADKVAGGDLLGGVLHAAPTAARNLGKAGEMAATGTYTDTRGRKVVDVDLADAFAKLVGFQPHAVSKVQEATRDTQQLIGMAKLKESEIADKMAKAVFKRDSAATQSAREELMRWNRNNPESPIRITPQQINKRVREMRRSKEERVAGTAPKEIRQQVQRELRGEGR